MWVLHFLICETCQYENIIIIIIHTAHLSIDKRLYSCLIIVVLIFDALGDLIWKIKEGSKKLKIKMKLC